MSARAVLDQTNVSLKLAYQPFLSSTQTKKLTSLLSSSLPYNFLPVTNTSLHTLPPQAEIVLLSRGGKPFAPIRQRRSVDSYAYQEFRQKDWQQSSKKYETYVEQYTQIQHDLPHLLATLRKYFSDHILDQMDFGLPLEILTYTGEVEDPDALRKTINAYIAARKLQRELYPILQESHALIKVAAHKAFGLPHLRAREYLIEDHRDRLDLFRLELEKRYMGMAMVRYPDIREPRPWILIPEDPVAAWGGDFPYRVDELIKLAQIRFLATTEEKGKALEEEAKNVIEDDVEGIVQEMVKNGEEVDFESLLEDIMWALWEKKTKMYHDDEKALSLPGIVGDPGPEFREPVTIEDHVVNQITDQELVKLGSWRVED